jgi:hypothetical protein
MRTATVTDATRAFEQAVQQGKEWMQKPAQQQLGDVVEAVGEQGVTAPLSAVALGGAGKVAGAAGEVAAEVAGKAGKAAAQVADHAPPLVKVAKKPKRPPKAPSAVQPAQQMSGTATTARVPPAARRRLSGSKKAEVDAANAAQHGGQKTCVHCGVEVVDPPKGGRPRGFKVDPREKQYDHIIPVSRGGVTSPNNMDISCASCNNKRGDTMGHPLNTR